MEDLGSGEDCPCFLLSFAQIRVGVSFFVFVEVVTFVYIRVGVLHVWLLRVEGWMEAGGAGRGTRGGGGSGGSCRAPDARGTAR